MYVLCDKTASFYSKIKNIINIPIIVCSSILSIINSTDSNNDINKLNIIRNIGIAFNLLIAISIAMLNFYKFTEKEFSFRVHATNFLKLNNKINAEIVRNNNNNDSSQSQIEILNIIYEYNNISENIVFHFPSRIKKYVIKNYKNYKMPSLVENNNKEEVDNNISFNSNNFIDYINKIKLNETIDSQSVCSYEQNNIDMNTITNNSFSKEEKKIILDNFSRHRLGSTISLFNAEEKKQIIDDLKKTNNHVYNTETDNEIVLTDELEELSKEINYDSYESDDEYNNIIFNNILTSNIVYSIPIPPPILQYSQKSDSIKYSPGNIQLSYVNRNKRNRSYSPNKLHKTSPIISLQPNKKIKDFMYNSKSYSHFNQTLYPNNLFANKSAKNVTSDKIERNNFKINIL